MLRLNYELLTSERIVDFCARNMELLSKPQLEGSRVPSELRKLKEKLKLTFFRDEIEKKDALENKKKGISDAEILEILDTDSRFSPDYLKLQAVLRLLFSTEERDVNVDLIRRLISIEAHDWRPFANEFDKKDGQYCYFDSVSESQRGDLKQLFYDLSVSIHAQIVWSESEKEKAEELAYDYAYKCMALLMVPNEKRCDFNAISKEIEQILTKTDTVLSRPFHDAFLVKLDPFPNGREIVDKAGWHRLILSQGVKAFHYWLVAPRLEKRKEKKSGQRAAPISLKEASVLESECFYERSLEDLNFSSICHRYKVSEARFDAALDYIGTKWPKKENDFLPDIVAEVQHGGSDYFWVKMPFYDKRALILGDITDCCQSILGNAEQAVKDSVSLSYNGVYVLLKKTSLKAENPPFFNENGINDQDYKIISQSYAWLSLTGDLCLDSIELLSNEISEDALHAIVIQFSRKAVNAGLGIACVTLGVGGKTPPIFTRDFVIPQQMREGIAYGDANKQYFLDFGISSLNKAVKGDLRKVFYDIPEYLFEYFCSHIEFDKTGNFLQIVKQLSEKEVLSSLKISKQKRAEIMLTLIKLYTFGFLEDLKHAEQHIREYALFPQKEYFDILKAFHNNPELQNKVKIESILTFKNPLLCFELLCRIQDMGLLEERFLALFWKSKTPGDFVMALDMLSKTKLLEKPWSMSALENPSGHIISTMLNDLNQVGLLTEENVEKILNLKKTMGIKGAFQCLCEANMLTQRNVSLLLAPSHSDLVSSTFGRFLGNLRHFKILCGDFAQSNFELCLCRSDTEQLDSVLCFLYENTSILADAALLQQNFESLMRVPDPKEFLRKIRSLGAQCTQEAFDNLVSASLLAQSQNQSTLFAAPKQEESTPSAEKTQHGLKG